MDILINDFSPGLFIVQTILLLGLIFLLVKFAWKPILTSLNEREELDRLRQVCTSTHSSGSEAHSECMEEKVNRAERCFRGRREKTRNI